ncbi:hypothetical protein SLS62_009666 [Diatrype stigma]|uniref:Uncharacterized protein n=1 Tax=Diatrype stigma TaxID=117547 RepID=A0AAN9YKH9_9PEZI
MFEFFLGLAHGHEMNTDNTSTMLVRIAKYCEMHRLEALVRPRIEYWIRAARRSNPFNNDPIKCSTEPDWLSIGYQFGVTEPFHEASLRLAYWVPLHDSIDLWYNEMELSLPSSVYNKIVECRSNFLNYVLEDLIHHFHRAEEVLQTSPFPETGICRSGSKECVSSQFFQIQSWLEMSEIRVEENANTELRYGNSTESPFQLFESHKIDLTGFCGECKQNGPLREILLTLQNDMGIYLEEFLQLSPDHCPITKEQMEHMAERKRSIDSAVASS